MKIKFPFLFLMLALFAGVHHVKAQGTAFTYQGQLYSGTNPANGTYNFAFSLFNALSGGSQVGTTHTNLGVSVNNGLFLTTVDFGPEFTGASNWLQIAVATNGSSTFTNLTPRQPLTPTPYAIFATTASNLSGAVLSANLSGTYANAVTLNNAGNSFSGNGSGLTSLNASQLTSGTVPDGVLSGDVALLNGNQAFTGSNSFSGLNASLTISGTGQINTGIYTGLGFQFYNGSGEGAIISSVNDAAGLLTFYTKPGTGFPPAKQMKLDRNGVLFIDQQNANYGALNDNTTNGDGIVFGGGSEGIASQRTAGVNQNGLDFYTSHTRQMSILNNGYVGIGTTNPATTLQVNGTVTATAFSGNGAGLTNLNLSVPIYSDGNNNFFAGPFAGNRTTAGAGNTAVGGYALSNSTNDSYVVGIGYQALENDNAGTSTLISGHITKTYGENTALGYEALQANTTGTSNTAVGYQALSASLTGNGNTAVGTTALAVNTAYLNTAVGNLALAASTSAAANTALGEGALANLIGGNQNLALGYLAGSAYTGSENNNIDIGYAGVTGEANVIHLGNNQTDTYVSGEVHAITGLNLDFFNQNTGTVSSNALVFGSGATAGNPSGEGIASKRTSGGTQYDLEFYTAFNQRMAILANGYVGIGKASPTALLEVNGNALIDANLSCATLSVTSGNLTSGPINATGAINASGLVTGSSFTTTGTINAGGSVTCCSITITGGCDLAEPFPVSNANQQVSEGAVMVIDDTNPGQLKLASQPYDTKVAGVVSGANGINPGIQMQQQGLLDGGRNVALTGRVYVQADASNGPIQPGDLLTTSSNPGRAMKVTDHVKAQGAILGKAMTGLKDGQGMVLVLVTLQ